MSNAIQINNGTIMIATKHLDQKLVEMIKRAQLDESLPAISCGSVLDNEVAQYNMVWYFLSKNVTFIKNSMIIRFGQGRSIHTWRDFEALIIMINHFWRTMKTFNYRFMIYDEGDGYQHVNIYGVNLGAIYRFPGDQG